tara:strand:- start:131 stop:601 length:471 start_codon:yes stop_codon:yes gene_type:complete
MIDKKDAWRMLSAWAAIKIAVVIAVLSVIFYFNMPTQTEQTFGAPRFGTEVYWQDIIHEELSQRDGWESLEKEHRLDDGTRVDLLFPEQACEIDWANKWAEGVGQSIYYGLKTRKAPLVILLAKKDGWEKYRDRVQYCGVDCWVYDTRTQEWTDKE